MSADATLAISLDRVGKTYGRVKALSDVSLDVRTGEIFGFLGLNGAGKTTTIRILLDLVRPSAGQAFVFGMNCRTESLGVRARVGYLPGELGVYRDMTGEATLALLARLGDRAVDTGRQRALLDRFELSRSDLGRKLREYSTGMKRKLGLVQAFQSDAPLLILDEPTDGLDPLMQEAVYELLVETRRRGQTVFMSSHVLPEVERVCDRIGLLRRGGLVLVTSTGDVRQLAGRNVRVLFREDVVRPDPATRWPDGCEVVALTARLWSLRIRGPLGPMLTRLASLPVEDLQISEPHLEDVLRRYYADEPGAPERAN
jgi:ABC-2 type transport system ATP-binding protein